jgi:hypothetical protein
MTKVTTSGTQLRPDEPSASLAICNGNSANHVVPGSLNDDLLVREAITVSIKRSGKSREQIADEMSRTLAIAVTARMISSFTAESKELHRWPGAWDRAFCAAVNDDTVLKCRAEAAGYQLIKDEEIHLLELGREYLQQKHAAERIHHIEKLLAGGRP